MLTLDNDYGALGILIQKEAQARGIPYEMKELNPQGYGDVFFLGLDGRYSGEIKQGGEFAGDPAHCVAQLKAQCQNAEFAYLFTYGQTEPAEDGNTYGMKLRTVDTHYNKATGAEYSHVKTYSRRHLKVAYTAQRKILWRIRQEGFHVVECRDLADLAFELCNWYEVGTTIGTTFSRLQPEKYRVQEQDQQKRNLMLALMGLPGAGIGEEVAEALANHFTSIAEIVNYFNNDGERETGGELSTALLRSGKRTIGPAAVQKLRTALGC